MPTPSFRIAPAASRLIHISLLVLVGLAAYQNTFDAPMVFDDTAVLLSKGIHTKLDNFLIVRNWGGSRVFAMLTFAVNYKLHGTAVAGYHVVNLAIHLTAATMLYLYLGVLLSPTISDRPTPLSPAHQLAPIFAALLFVAHPVQTQAVTYIVQRFTSLAALFYLSAMLCYALARRHHESAPQQRSPAVGWYLGALACTLLAMRCKESAFTLPFALLLYEWLFGTGTWRSRLLHLLPFALTLTVIPLGLLSLAAPGDGLAILDKATHVDTVLGRYEYFLTQCRVIVTYLRLLVLPINQNLDYDYPVYTSLTTPPVLLSLLFLAGTIALVVRTGLRLPREAHTSRIAVFGTLFFFLALSVESSVIPIRDVIFEHRLYLPAAGAFMAFTVLFAQSVERLRQRRGNTYAIALVGICLTVMVLAVATHHRNRVWQSELRLVTDTARKSPDKVRPLINLAAYHIAHYQPAAGIAPLRHALQIEPQNYFVWYNLGMALGQLRQLDEAEQSFRKAIELQNGFQNAYAYLAWTLEQMGKFQEAVVYYRKALTMDPQDTRSRAGLERAAKGALQTGREHAVDARMTSPATR